MKRIKTSGNTGLTLLELLVSVSAIAVVSILIAQVFFTTTKVNRATITVQELKQTGDFAVDSMERMVRNSRGWSYSCNNGETSTKSATFLNPDLKMTTLTCLSDGIAARIASVSADGSISYLTGNTMSISNTGGTTCTDSSLLFSCSPLTGEGPLSIKFTLVARGIGINPADPDYLKFETSVQSRNIE